MPHSAWGGHQQVAWARLRSEGCTMGQRAILVVELRTSLGQRVGLGGHTKRNVAACYAAQRDLTATELQELARAAFPMTHAIEGPP